MEIDCIICFYKFDEELFIKFDYDQIICLKCYEKLLNYNRVLCPICRKSIDIKNNSNIQINNRDITNYDYHFCLMVKLCYIFVVISIISSNCY